MTGLSPLEEKMQPDGLASPESSVSPSSPDARNQADLDRCAPDVVRPGDTLVDDEEIEATCQLIRQWQLINSGDKRLTILRCHGFDVLIVEHPTVERTGPDSSTAPPEAKP